MEGIFHRKCGRKKTNRCFQTLLSSSLNFSFDSVINLIICIFICCSFQVVAGVSSPKFIEFNFVTEPSSVVVKEGGEAVLDCEVSYTGQGKVKLEWVKNGDNIKLAETQHRYILANGSLFFPSVQRKRADQGEYRCAASVDQLGTILSRKGSLDLAYLSRDWSSQPQSLTLGVGDTAAFECLIDGSPQPEVEWFKGDRKIIPSTDKFVYPTGVLEISALSKDDLGPYLCHVRVMGKTRASTFGVLGEAPDHELKGIPKFVLRPRSAQAVRGETVFLHCVAHGRDRSNKPPVISWLKDGTTIVTSSDNNHMKVVGAGTLVISDVLETDSGIYTCRAMNQEDSVDTDAELTVLVPPKFVVEPHDTTQSVQSDVTLNCQAQGMPSPRITWLKNGDTLQPSNYFKISQTGSLSILGLMNADNGVYQCVAGNVLGEVTTSAQLMVTSDVPLSAPVPPYSAALSVGEIYAQSENQLVPGVRNLQAVLVKSRFATVAWGLPDVPAARLPASYAVFWREHGSQRERVSNTTLTEFNIQGLRPGTEYEIRVRAYGQQGSSKTEAKITVTTEQEVLVPSAPQDLQVKVLSPRSIRVMWAEPQETKGTIVSYTLLYYKKNSKSENEVTGVRPRSGAGSYVLNDLEEYTEYNFRVVAFNENGPGLTTTEVDARTLSDKPTKAPQNFTLEVRSSTELVVRWQPPPPTAQNGVITGYKIRVRRKVGNKGNKDKGITQMTDGDRDSYAFTNLVRDTEYQVRILAMTVNGTGPFTNWAFITTYRDDLDESNVPPKPAHLLCQPQANSIVVSWSPPPANSKILVRGYTLGFGKGVPDVYSVSLDANTNRYVIKNLQPSSEYVIAVRAFNKQGDGRSRMESVTTSENTALRPSPEPAMTPLMPPMGLNAHVLSPSTILLTWADHSLSRGHKILDDRYYTIMYKSLSGGKYKYQNATDLNYHIEGLRPNTEYEFMVKYIRGRRASQYSMAVRNKTQEKAPDSAPRDVTPVPLETNSLAVSLNWQPPARPNGQITGYLIYYTNEAHTDDVLWPMEGVVGEKLSAVIEKLTADTTYHFKVQARNSMGLSPRSEAVTYRTPKVEVPKAEGSKDQGLDKNVIIIVAACGAGLVICTVFIVVIVYLCNSRRKQANSAAAASKMTKIPPPAIKQPPDLWIHQPSNHELHKMERSNRSESSSSVAHSTLRRGSRGSGDHTDDQASTLDRRRNSYIEDRGYPSSSEERYQPVQPRNLIRPKPITLPVDARESSFREPLLSSVSPNGHMLPYGDNSIPMRPIYPRTQYNTQYSSAARVNAGDVPHTCPPTTKLLSSVDEDERDHELNGSGMEDSFHSRIGYVKPQQSISPYKKPTAPVASVPKGQRTPVSFNSKSPELKQKKEDPDLSKSLSTEELTAEMANLEGLMKDLNAITQQEFEC